MRSAGVACLAAAFVAAIMALATPAAAEESQWDAGFNKNGCTLIYKTKPDRATYWTLAIGMTWSTHGQFSFALADSRAADQPALPVQITSATGARFSGDAVPIDPNKPSAGYRLEIQGRKDLELALVGDLTFTYRGRNGQQINVTAPFGIAVPRIDACVSRASALAAPAQTAGDAGASGGAAPPEQAGPDPTLIATGSGVAVDLKGHILTNAHVVEGCPRMVNPLLGTAEVVAVDKASDLALLHLARRPPGMITFRTGALKLGEPVIAAGFPLSFLLQNGLNVTAGNLSALSGPEGDRRYVQHTAPTQPGNSGGPLMDRSGRLLGLVVARADAKLEAQNVNWAVALSTIQSFLDENMIAYQAGGDAPLSPELIASQARTHTILLECRK